MKKKIWLILICSFIYIPIVKADYQKKCTDYTYDTCPDGKTDERGNTCKAAGDSCYIRIVGTNCQAVKPYSCSEANGYCCGVDSVGNSCTYDISTKKCKNVVTYSRKAACADFKYEECPAYSENGTACIKYDNLCQSKEAVENSQNETAKTSNEETITSEGQIKAITCTGNEQDQIPANVPRFIRSLYNRIKILVPLFIIFLGMFDFIRVVVSTNNENMDQQKNKFMRRLIAGIAIFFVLTITQWVFGLIGEKENILGCISCFLTTEKDCQEAGYIDPSKNDENSAPNKTPPNSNNKVTETNKKDDKNSNSSTNNSNNSNNNSSSNNSSSNNNSSNNNSSNNSNSSNNNSSNSNNSNNKTWYCTQYSYEECPTSKTDSTGKVCRKFKRDNTKTCKSGFHCYDYSDAKLDCPVGRKDDYGKICRKYKKSDGTYSCKGYDS